MTARLIALLALVAAIAAPAAVADEERHATLRDFARTGKYTLYISGKDQKKARIYHSRRAGAFLVLDSDHPKPFLILPRERKVATLETAELLEVTDKSVDVAAKAEPEDLGEIGFEGADVLINLEDKLVARLRPRPWLLGEADAAEMLLHTPDYEVGAKRYHPNEHDLRKLIECATETEVTIFFGTWCPTCQRLLPRILRVDEALEGSKVKITYYGLPKGSAMKNEPEARKYGIRAVPTGIVFVDGKQVGTLSSRALSRPESALCGTLSR